MGHDSEDVEVDDVGSNTSELFLLSLELKTFRSVRHPQVLQNGPALVS